MRRVPSEIVKVRRSQLLSQVDLAIESGVRCHTLTKIERGLRPVTPDEAQRIASALNVPINRIFTEDSDR